MSFFTLPELKKCCCCMRLVTGVRIVTGMALGVGEAYIFLGVTLFDHFCPTLVVASAISYYVAGGLFCLWFLLLLLIQSLESKIPRILVMVHTKVLMIWLVLMFCLLVLSLRVVTRQKFADEEVYEKDKTVITIGILFTFCVFLMTSYSLLILKSYINNLEEQEAIRRPRVRFVSLSSVELEDFVSDLPKLSAQNPNLRYHHRDKIIKTLRHEARRFRPSLPPIRPSQISVISESQLSAFSLLSRSLDDNTALPNNILPPENTAPTEISTDNVESGQSQQKTWTLKRHKKTPEVKPSRKGSSDSKTSIEEKSQK